MKERLLVLGEAIARLVAEKNKAYGDSIGTSGDVLRILYPDGIKPEQYDDLLLIARSIDKFTRIARGERTAFGESPYIDLAGYAMRGALRDEELYGGAGQAEESMAKNEDHIQVWPTPDTGYRSSLLRRRDGVRAGERF